MWPCLQDRQVQELETGPIKIYVENRNQITQLKNISWHQFPQMCDTSEYTSVETDGFSAT